MKEGRSSVISMRSYPSQYPCSSNPLNPSPSLPLFFPLPPHQLFLSFPPFSSVFFWSLSFHFLSFFPDPLLLFSPPFPHFCFQTLSTFIFLGVCVRVSSYVCACVLYHLYFNFHKSQLSMFFLSLINN